MDSFTLVGVCTLTWLEHPRTTPCRPVTNQRGYNLWQQLGKRDMRATHSLLQLTHRQLNHAIGVEACLAALNYVNIAPFLTDADGNDPLMLACKNGQEIVAKLLIKSFREHNVNAYGNNAFTIACLNGHVNLACALLREFPDLDVDHVDIYGRTALQTALCLNQHNVAELLFKCRCKDFNRKMSDALVFASDRGHGAMVKVLLKVIAEKRSDLYKVNGYDSLPFVLACQNGHTSVVDSFLRYLRQHDSNVISTFGILGMVTACRFGHLDIVDLLLANKVWVNCEFEQTPLIAASENGHYEVVSRLLREAEVDFNRRDSSGRTAVMAARANRHKNVEELLMGLADIDTDFSESVGGWLDSC